MKIKLVLSLIRHILTGTGATLVGMEWLTGTEADQAVGALMTVVSVLWSVAERRKQAATAALFLLATFAASSAWAQSSTVTAEWDYIGRPIAQVAKEPQTLLIDGVAVAATPTCIAKPGGAASDSMCSVSFPTPASGPKTYTVRAVQGGVTAQTVYPGLDVAAAKPPTGFRPTITVTVTITP